MDRDPHEAAEDAVDSERLLPGEDPQTSAADDAAHWHAVYTELVSFKDEILQATIRRASSMVGSAREEVERTDLPLLQAEAERLRRRLDFWRGRLTEIGETF